MRPFVVGHAVLLAVAALLAWRVASAGDEEKGGDQEVVLLDVKPEALQRVSFAWPKGQSTIDVKGAKDARVLAVHVDREKDVKPPKKAPKAASDAGPVDMPVVPVEREIADFMGGKNVAKAVETLAPLKARRSLGAVDPERLKAMGLVEPQRTLTLDVGGQPTVLEVGEATYGGQARYARVKGSTEVVLLESSVVSGLEGGAQQLMERRVVDAPVEEVAGLVVKAGDKTVKYVHVDRDQPAKRHFATPDDPTKESEEASSLVSTLRGLRVTAYATPEDVKEAGDVGAYLIDLVDAPDLEGVILQNADGTKFWVRSGPWTREIAAAQGKELVEDMQAAAP